MKRYFFLFCLYFICCSVIGLSQVSLSNGSPSYTQNFDAMGTSLTLVSNWRIGAQTASPTWSTASTTLTQQASSGTPATGGTYNWGTSAGERAIGAMTSGAFASPNSPICYFTNGGTTNITSVTIAYDAERYRVNSAAASIQFYYSVDGNTWTSVPSGDIATSSFPTGVSAYTFASPLTVNMTGINITGLNIGVATDFYLRWNINTTGANSQGIGIDNFSITATFSSNSITTGTVSSPPFILGNCSATVTGTVDFTSTGTFTGNTYTAQLSDDIGSFASPVTIGTLVSDLNSGTINIMIPAGTVSGTGYLIRVVSNNPATIGSNSSAFSIVQQGVGGCASSHSDYFRSNGTGDWSLISTWQSSPDNSNWINATISPDYNNNTITIQAGHIVIISTNVTADQVLINNTATLLHSAGTFTIHDGTGNDIEILSGGTLQLSVAGGPAMGTGTPTVNVQTGGNLKVSNTGMTGAGTGVNSANYVYQDASILEYSSNSPFSSSSVTFFPNVNSTTIPIFRTSNTSVLTVGAANPTTINGIFECNGAGVTWTGTGTKTFRNGIRGTGPVDGSAAGLFVISGATAELGGSGSLIVPTPGSTGLDINAGSTVTLSSDKTVTGRIDLLGPNTYIVLGNYNLTGTTTVNISETTSWVKTTGTGKLTINSVSSPYPFFSKIFPVGVSTVNPVIIASPTTGNYSVRVTEPASAGLFDPTRAVQRTWYITSSLTAPSAEIRFGYTDPGDGGVNFLNSNLQIGVNPNGTWSIHQGGLSPVAFPVGTNTWTVTGTGINYFTANGPEILFAVGTSGAILPLDYFIIARAQKRNNSGIISWDIYDDAAVRNFEIQRSINNSGFTTIGTMDPVSNQLSYAFTDPQLEKGINLYRIKVNRISGDTRYSNTTAIINGGKGILITSIFPNPVRNEMNIELSSATRSTLNFEIYDMAGKRCFNIVSPVAEGSNRVSINTAALPAGVYQRVATSQDAKTTYRFVKN